MRSYRSKKQRYVIVNSEGKILAKFRYKLTAIQTIPRLKFNKKEKLKIIELD
jgi:hypothetical protein